jgi:hypothetical protein
VGTPVDGRFAGKAEKCGLKQVVEQYQLDPAQSEGDKFSIAFIGHHLLIRLRKTGGAVNPAKVRRLLCDSEQDLTFVRIGQYGSLLEIALPLACGHAAVGTSLKAIADASLDPVDAIPTDEIAAVYGMDIREGIIPESVIVPDSFVLGMSL